MGGAPSLAHGEITAQAVVAASAGSVMMEIHAIAWLKFGYASANFSNIAGRLVAKNARTFFVDIPGSHVTGANA